MMHSCSEKRMMMWSLSLVFSLSNSILVFGSHANHLCRPDQKNALWEFKSEFYVQRLDLWKSDAKTVKWRNNTDCCFWDGISCDPKTGKVVKLNLQGSYLNGPLRSNSSLFRLQYLQNLDLNDNNISGVLPDSIGNLKHLRVLSLSKCSFFGKISSSLGNLSYLTDLHLYDNGFIGELPNSMGNLNRLTDLRLHINKLSGNFPPMLFNLSELTAIYLSSNQFDGMLPSNMSSLSKLESFDISENSFSGSIPSSLFVIPSLMLLNLNSNDFSSPVNIGNNISSPSKLRILILGGKNLNGPIPRFISKLVRLMYLDLSFWNTRRSMVDFSIFLHLKSLEFLYLSYLNTRSMVDLSLFSSLVSLADLDLSGNNVKISSTLHLPSPIKFLALSSCNISEFPKFLQSQTRLDHIDISANQIEGQVPKWLWRLPMLRSVNISHNSLSGFQGSAVVIQSSEKLSVLDISANSFLDFPLLPKSLVHFLGSENQFSGEIPREICELVSLKGLVLSNNNFSGSIPPCFENFNTNISVLHLQNNNLSGGFPEESIGDQLRSLDIGHNLLSGELPKSLINCTYLEFLNVEDNLFSDTFPFWLRLLPHLQILVLRSNKFYGPISLHGVSLSFPKLRIFDISENRFTGVLPSDYFVGWTALSSVIDNGRISYTYSVHHKSVALVIKGLKMELVGSVFTMYKTIDVSGNRFQGDISESIGLLKELTVLNMSNNDFTGRIPPSLGNLSNIQSLDLSQNKLSGEIPPELGRLTFLARMNFSYNMLEGPIPQGTQIQSQNSSSFAENPGLCGAPLIENCGRGGGGGGEATKQEQEQERKDEKYQVLIWIAAAIAYVPGLLCGLVIGHILTSNRHDWFMRIFHCFG